MNADATPIPADMDAKDIVTMIAVLRTHRPVLSAAIGVASAYIGVSRFNPIGRKT
jgi:hypothetical protein